MYDDFTDRARKVMKLAEQEARRLNQEYIGTEHVLVGIAQEGSGVGAKVLQKFDIDLPKLRREVAKLTTSSPNATTMDDLPLSPAVRTSIDSSRMFVRTLKHSYVGTEHLLLGLVAKLDSTATRSLSNLGATASKVLVEVLDLLGCKFDMPNSKVRRISYEHFTNEARQVMQRANSWAQQYDHEYIGTEHVLLGLVENENNTAARILNTLNVNLETIRREVDKLIQSGPSMVAMGNLPQTPRAKQVIGYAMEESRSLNHNHVGPEHILLGLLRDRENVGGVILVNQGLSLEQVRQEVIKLVPPGDN